MKQGNVDTAQTEGCEYGGEGRRDGFQRVGGGGTRAGAGSGNL